MAAHASIKLSALMSTYLDDLQVRGYKPKTIAGYQAKLNRFTRLTSLAPWHSSMPRS